MNRNQQLDIFSRASDLDIFFDHLPSQRGSQQHAIDVTQHAKHYRLPVCIVESILDKKFPFHVVVVEAQYTLNAFNCLSGAEQFIARHQLTTG